MFLHSTTNLIGCKYLHRFFLHKLFFSSVIDTGLLKPLNFLLVISPSLFFFNFSPPENLINILDFLNISFNSSDNSFQLYASKCFFLKKSFTFLANPPSHLLSELQLFCCCCCCCCK